MYVDEFRSRLLHDGNHLAYLSPIRTLMNAIQLRHCEPHVSPEPRWSPNVRHRPIQGGFSVRLGLGVTRSSTATSRNQYQNEAHESHRDGRHPSRLAWESHGCIAHACAQS